MFNNFAFYNGRPITKSLLTWWTFQDNGQDLLPLDLVLKIEHIYAKNRNDKEHTLTNRNNVEMLGNKALLEKRINIRASDYRFEDKKVYYKGYINKRGQVKESTKIHELLLLADTKTDFIESDLIDRNNLIINSFLQFVCDNDLTI